jgi:hypothetical protein
MIRTENGSVTISSAVMRAGMGTPAGGCQFSHALCDSHRERFCSKLNTFVAVVKSPYRKPPYATVAEYSAERAQELWFLLTRRGIEMLRTLDIQSGHSPWFD